MADLTSESRRSDAVQAADGRNRGQLLLVGAFGLAVLLLVLAGTLNTVTYTQTLASQDDSIRGGRDVAVFQAAVREGVGGAVARINANETATYLEKDARVGRSVNHWQDAAADHYAMDVTAVNASVDRTTEGSRIAQENASTLTNVSGVGDWTLAENVSNTRRFRLNLSRDSLVDGSCATNECYELVVNASSTWTVSVNRTNVTVSGSSTGQCAVRTDPVVVDLTDGTVGGRECPALTFAEGLSAPYDIEYQNGGNANGTYRLVVDVDESTVVDGDYGTDAPPSVSPAVYATYVQVTYRTPQTDYATQIRIARGESDE